MKSKYVITVDGYYDSTEIIYELTKKEYELIYKIALEITLASKSTRMPTMDIDKKRKGEDK